MSSDLEHLIASTYDSGGQEALVELLLDRFDDLVQYSRKQDQDDEDDLVRQLDLEFEKLAEASEAPAAATLVYEDPFAWQCDRCGHRAYWPDLQHADCVCKGCAYATPMSHVLYYGLHAQSRANAWIASSEWGRMAAILGGDVMECRTRTRMNRANHHYKEVSYLNTLLDQATGRHEPRDAATLQKLHAILSKEMADAAVPRQQVDGKWVRTTLKRLKMGRYYKHGMLLANRLAGRQLLKLDHRTEEQLRNSFLRIKRPFDRLRGTHCRKSFPNYNYVIRQLLHLVDGRADSASAIQCHFPLLKSKVRLAAHDRMWMALCNELNWPFRSLLPEYK